MPVVLGLATNLFVIYVKAWLLMLLNGWAHSSQDNIPALGWKFWVAAVIAHTVLRFVVDLRFHKTFEFEQAELP